MAAVLRKMAEAEGAGVDDEDGIERALLTDTRMSAETTRQCQRSWEGRPEDPKGQA